MWNFEVNVILIESRLPNHTKPNPTYYTKYEIECIDLSCMFNKERDLSKECSQSCGILLKHDGCACALCNVHNGYNNCMCDVSLLHI